ncbi:hypothetical protein Tco_0624030 [Tanacetum coccineum]|uniref:Uncharacterized protein n=1 Tax=Tanacetum coccineum TaxID=301880 RepID=A0ABQ4WCV0_9ASTR
MKTPQKRKGLHAVPPTTEKTKSSQSQLHRNKVIIEDWVDSDDEETDVSESQKETAFNSENSETSFENRQYLHEVQMEVIIQGWNNRRPRILRVTHPSSRPSTTRTPHRTTNDPKKNLLNRSGKERKYCWNPKHTSTKLSKRVQRAIQKKHLKHAIIDSWMHWKYDMETRTKLLEALQTTAWILKNIISLCESLVWCKRHQRMKAVPMHKRTGECQHQKYQQVGLKAIWLGTHQEKNHQVRSWNRVPRINLRSEFFVWPRKKQERIKACQDSTQMVLPKERKELLMKL